LASDRIPITPAGDLLAMASVSPGVLRSVKACCLRGPAHYDGTPDIDINALLSLYFLETFPNPVGRTPTRSMGDGPVPAATRQFGTDLLDCLTVYGGRLPAAGFIGPPRLRRRSWHACVRSPTST
jgi:hypothetical protein